MLGMGAQPAPMDEPWGPVVPLKDKVMGSKRGTPRIRVLGEEQP